MQCKEQKGIKWLEFDLLSEFPKVVHGIFLRHGGHSKGNFSSLNFGFHIGDPSENVNANMDLLKQLLKISEFSRGNQVHQKTVCKVNMNQIIPQESCDGLMTNTPGIGLLIKHADCQAALFYDPILHVAANVHSGWRGSVANIYEASVNSLKKDFGSKPENLLVCISPSLGPDDAEFINYRTELPEHFWPFQVKPNYFDFWEISKMQLVKCGVLPDHIEIAKISTYTNTNDYFSYRREKITGRNAAVIALR